MRPIQSASHPHELWFYCKKKKKKSIFVMGEKAQLVNSSRSGRVQTATRRCMGTTAFLGCHDAVPHWLNWARTCSQLLQKSNPDIMQIRCQVNELLPVELCKSSPDRSLSMTSSEVLAPPMDHGDPVPTTRAPLFPSRTPPLSPTSKDQDLQSTRSKGSARRC